MAQADGLLAINQNMAVVRRVWVRRPGASATLVAINEDDVVDDLRDNILLKYSNALGRHFDAPDLTLRIEPREQRVERSLRPDEPVARTLEAYYPGGQTVDEALVIEVPLRRTPRPSPRAGPPHAPNAMTYLAQDDARLPEIASDYFGPGAMAAAASTLAAPATSPSHGHAMTVLTTGQVPQIPSPGGTRSRQHRDRSDRPKLARQHTSSPSALAAAGSSAYAGSAPIGASTGMYIESSARFTN